MEKCFYIQTEDWDDIYDDDDDDDERMNLA